MEQEHFSAASWQEARKIASLVGVEPNLFTSCIRFLHIDSQRNQGRVSKVSRYCADALLRSPSIKVSLYFAIKTFRPGELESRSFIGREQIYEIFSPGELSVLLTLLYLYRRVKKGVESGQFSEIAEQLTERGEIGGHLGEAMPSSIGLAQGLLAGTMRHMALAMFLGIDEARFLKYKKFLQAKNRLLDRDEELSIWGCTHAQVAAMLMQVVGIAPQLSGSFAEGWKNDDLNDPALSPAGYTTRIATFWTDHLYATGAVPQITHRGAYYPVAAKLERLLTQVKRIRDTGSPYIWLERGRGDVNPQTTPHLCNDPAEGKDQLDSDTIDDLKDIEDTLT